MSNGHGTKPQGSPFHVESQPEHVTLKCWLGLHAWAGGKRFNSNPEPFSLSPFVGSRVCARCGKRQRFLWDSQGGAWETIR